MSVPENTAAAASAAAAPSSGVDRERLLAEIRAMMVELFELDAASITPEAELYSDLELDSIDAVDMVVQVQKTLNRRIDPATFRTVRTVSDVVQVVAAMLEEQGAASLEAAAAQRRQ